MNQPDGSNDRLDRGTRRLSEIDGGAIEAMVASLGDLGRYVVEFAYGDIHTREGLSARDRELVSVAVLTALGARERQLEAHLKSALNVGLSIAELREVIIQTVPYAGFPTAINAMYRLESVEASRITQ